MLTSAQLSSQIPIWQKTDYISSSNFPHAWKELVEILSNSPQVQCCLQCLVTKLKYLLAGLWSASPALPAWARAACLLCWPPLLSSQGDVLDQLKASCVAKPAWELWVGPAWRYPQLGWMLNEVYGVLCLIVKWKFLKITRKCSMHVLKRGGLAFGKFTFAFVWSLFSCSLWGLFCLKWSASVCASNTGCLSFFL